MARRHGLTIVGPATFKIEEVLGAAPSALPSDPDVRTGLLERKLRTGDPLRLAEVVRDLALRQRRGQATTQDLRLLWRAERILARRLAAHTGKERRRARRRMWGTVERTIALHI